ncbi:sulfotransferase [Thalassospira sp. MA62]|nr:sulfotransferase [Thalassospira sp. MA62]
MAQAQNDIAKDLKAAMSTGAFDKAIRIGERLIKKYPKRTDIEIMTAVSEMRADKDTRAGQRLRRLFRNISTNDRFFAPVSQNLVQYAFQTGDFDSVEKVVEDRYRAKPSNSAVAVLFGQVVFQHETRKSPGLSYAPRLSDGLNALAKVSTQDPRYREARKMMARIHLHQQQYADVFAILEDLVTAQPDDLETRLLLASSYAAAGETESAVSNSLELINAAPDFSVQPYNIVAFMKVGALPESAEATLRAILTLPPKTADEHYKAAFSLAKIEESRGNMEAAFDFYKLGHQANRKARPVDMKGELDELIELGNQAKQYAAADAPAIRIDPTKDAPGPRPIFIVGMPRSGTTLTERILGAHPDVFAAGEIGDLARIAQDELAPAATSRQVSLLDQKSAEKIRKRYLEALASYAPDAKFVANKTPANFMRLELIRRIFPDAPIIHTRRHPLATCLSLYTTPFAIPMRFADDLGDLADYYRGYQDLMKVFLETDPNGQIFDLSYEQLVADPEKVAPEFLAHCGLDWRDECLEFYRAKQTAATASMLQVRRPIYKESVGKWQRFEPFIGPLADLKEQADSTV